MAGNREVVKILINQYQGDSLNVLVNKFTKDENLSPLYLAVRRND